MNLDGICEVDFTIQGYVINAILFCRHHEKGNRPEEEGPEKCRCNWLKIINSFKFELWLYLLEWEIIVSPFFCRKGRG